MLLGMRHAADYKESADGRNVNAADNKQKPVPFAEAVQFLRGKVPLTKTEWNKLEQKLRFRAFTVAQLAELDYINSARELLAAAVENGETYANFFEHVKDLTDKNALALKAGYWENVYRTNTASAYSAGKLMQYEHTKPAAYELFVINDSRTTDICRHLLLESGYGMTLPATHEFWQKYGFPPYHYQCRTSFRGVDEVSIGAPAAAGGVDVNEPDIRHFNKFKPQKGFGGNQLENGNWYMMQPSQMERAIKYGILNMFNREENVFADYESVWKGYKRHPGQKGGWYDLCNNPPNDWETDNKPVVELLVNEGHQIKVIPTFENTKDKYNVKWSNPDIILDGKLADIKRVEESIISRFKSAKDQKLKNAVIVIPDSFTEKEIYNAFSLWSSKQHGRLNILWIYKGVINKKCFE